jgi:polyhydroxyalkanoate synthase
MAKVMSSLAGQPDAVLQAQGDLWKRYADLWHFAARRAMGEVAEPVAIPAKGDKRFNAPDWTDNPVFDVIKQSYLITSDWMNGLVARAGDVDPMTRRRVEFFTRMLTDALSPSNFRARASSGEWRTSPPTSPVAAASWPSARPTMSSSRSA